MSEHKIEPVQNGLLGTLKKYQFKWRYLQLEFDLIQPFTPTISP